MASAQEVRQLLIRADPFAVPLMSLEALEALPAEALEVMLNALSETQKALDRMRTMAEGHAEVERELTYQYEDMERERDRAEDREELIQEQVDRLLATQQVLERRLSEVQEAVERDE